MKVLHVMNGASWGGGNQLALLLCQKQRIQGITAEICFLDGGDEGLRVKQRGVPLHSYDADSIHTTKKSRWADLEQGYEKLVQEFQPDIIVTHFALSHLLTARVRKRYKRAKWIVVLHQSWKQFAYGSNVHGSILQKYFVMLKYALGDIWAAKHCDRVVAVSNAVRSDSLKLGMNKARVTTIYNGIEPSDPATMQNTRAKWGLSSDHRIIGSLGYFSPRKGYDLLIDAFNIIAGEFPDLQLVIAGGDTGDGGVYRQQLIQQRDQSIYSERIHILAEQASGAEFMFNVDICVVASREEPFSLVLAEAMQFGKPSVVTSAGGSKEVARDGQESLVFESGNITDLATQLERLLTDEELASTLGKAGAKRARTELTLDRCAREYIALYEEVLGESGSEKVDR